MISVQRQEIIADLRQEEITQELPETVNTCCAMVKK